MSTVTFEALRLTQPSGRHVYSFAAGAVDLLDIADIPRIKRGDDLALEGYQRPEVVGHIAEIRRYLESDEAILPNTIVLAFTENVEFEPYNPDASSGVSQSGRLKVTVAEGQDATTKPAFVVDGQQRLAAASSCKHAHFPLFVTAFVAPEPAEQRKQFVLVNRTKPLPQGLIFELLAEIDGHLPTALSKARRASLLTNRLNFSPGVLKGKIRTPTQPGGVIKDNSMRRAIANSLNDGALFQVAKSAGRDGWENEDKMHAAMQEVVATYWEGVSLAFPQAWDLPPKSSRLTHGVGIVALGFVMDHLHARRLKGADWNALSIANELRILAPHCAWTSGAWHFSDDDVRGWNVLQNTDRDVRLLAGYLARLVEEKL